MQVPIVAKTELEIADIDEDEFVHAILEDGDLKSDLKMPVDDDETYKTLKGIWDARGDKQVFFTILKACGKEKYIAGRYKEWLIITLIHSHLIHKYNKRC